MCLLDCYLCCYSYSLLLTSWQRLLEANPDLRLGTTGQAMEVKESTLSSKTDGKGRKRMFLSRLKKAVKYAEELEALAELPNVATDNTALEIVAYRGNIKGILAMEREDWVTAHREFKLSHALLGNLAKVSGTTREEVEVLGDRARDLEPSIRYCKYNMQGGEGKEVREDKN